MMKKTETSTPTQANQHWFEDYLQRKSRLSGFFHSQKLPGPPAQINEHILEAAKNHNSTRQWWHRSSAWAATVAMIAVTGLLSHQLWQNEQTINHIPSAPQLPESKRAEEMAIEMSEQSFKKTPTDLNQKSPREKESRLKTQDSALPSPPITPSAPSMPEAFSDSTFRATSEPQSALKPRKMISSSVGGITPTTKNEQEPSKSLVEINNYTSDFQSISNNEQEALQWSEQILFYINQNKFSQAQQLLAKLQKKYPDFPVDPLILEQISPSNPSEQR